MTPREYIHARLRMNFRWHCWSRICAMGCLPGTVASPLGRCYRLTLQFRRSRISSERRLRHRLDQITLRIRWRHLLSCNKLNIKEKRCNYECRTIPPLLEIIEVNIHVKKYVYKQSESENNNVSEKEWLVWCEFRVYLYMHGADVRVYWN